MRDLVGQIAAFVVASGLLGVGFGVLIGRATHRGRAAAKPVVQERVLVRTDLSLYRENERLRDRVVALRARVDHLEAEMHQVGAVEPDAAHAADPAPPTRPLSSQHTKDPQMARSLFPRATSRRKRARA